MTIGEFSLMTGISAYTLRYYEKKGLLRVSRDSIGRRDYNADDIGWVKFIKRLKDTGMLLRDIKRYSDLRYQGDCTMEERMELLIRHRQSVVEKRKKWDEYLDNLDEKIGIYRRRIGKKEKIEPEIELKYADCPNQVAAIVKKTIQSVYPAYYPADAVQFFLDLHSEARIEEVIDKEEIYLVVAQGNVVGTGSIRGNEICRLFILPEYQGKGYGSCVMDLLETKIFEKYPKVHVDASFPAESMYLKRGYQIASYERIETENGDFLCYHTMEKRKYADEVVIRPITPEEYPLLDDFLYDAIFLPAGVTPPPREIIRQPELALYVEDFGQPDDLCLVAVSCGYIVGAVWTRILAGEIKGYGNIDEQTPEFAISVKKEFRQQGIGKKLMQEMIALLKEKGYRQTSLSVNKENYACRMYQKLGFQVIRKEHDAEEQDEDYLMVLEL